MGKHRVCAWLINTGWNGGPYGIGSRIKLAYTRAMVHAALDGRLADVPMRRHPVFGVRVPESCPGVPSEVLDARHTWPDPAAYDGQALKLAGMFADNFRQFSEGASAQVRAAGPSV